MGLLWTVSFGHTETLLQQRSQSTESNLFARPKLFITQLKTVLFNIISAYSFKKYITTEEKNGWEKFWLNAENSKQGK